MNQFDPPVIAAFIAATVAILTLMANTFFAWLARRQQKKAVVAAFRSDIRSIVYVMNQLNTVGKIISVKKITVENLPNWEMYSPRGENYFELYKSLVNQIGATPYEFSREIVRFYAFLHASRDAASRFKTLTAEQVRNNQHIDAANLVLKALAETFDAAEKVLASKFSPAKIGIDEGSDIAASLRNLCNSSVLSQLNTQPDKTDANLHPLRVPA